jgi:hypothetical protein
MVRMRVDATQGSRKLRVTEPGQQSGRVKAGGRGPQGFDQHDFNETRQHKRLAGALLARLSFDELDDWRHAVDCRVGCTNVEHLWEKVYQHGCIDWIEGEVAAQQAYRRLRRLVAVNDLIHVMPGRNGLH